MPIDPALIALICVVAAVAAWFLWPVGGDDVPPRKPPDAPGGTA